MPSSFPLAPEPSAALTDNRFRTSISPRAFLVDADSAFVRKLLPELAGIYRALNEHLASLGLLPDIEAELKQTGSRLLIQTNTRHDGSTSARIQDADFDARAADLAVESTETVATSVPSNHRLIHSAEWVDTFTVNALSGQTTLAPFSRASPSRQLQPDELLEASGGRANFTPNRLLPPVRDEAGGARLLKNAENLLSSSQSSTLEIESESLRIAHEVATLRLSLIHI